MKDNGTEQAMQEDGISLLDLLQVLIKHKRFILRFCGVVALLSIVYSLLLPKIYTATAKVLPPQREGAGLSSLAALLGQSGGLAPLAGGMLGGGADLYIGILKSRSVEDAVIRRLSLDKVYKQKTPEGIRKTLEAKVKIQAERKSGIITIAADDREPKRAAAIANTFVDELSRKCVKLNLTSAGVERAFLEKRLEMVRTDLKNAEESMKSFQEKYKAIKVDSQSTAAIQGIAQLKAEIIAKEAQLASLRSYQTDENPQVKIIQSAISRLKSQLGAYEGSGPGGDAIPSVGNVPGLGLEYTRRLRELKIQELLFEQLTKQYEMAKLSEAKDSSSLQVLDEAVVPTRKSKPKRSRMVILSTFTAFFMSVFIVFMREHVERMPEEDRAQWNDIRSHAKFRLPWVKRDLPDSESP